MAAQQAGPAQQATWQEAMLAARAGAMAEHDFTGWPALEQDFPVESDWFLQDLAACGLPLSQKPSGSERLSGPVVHRGGRA